MIGEPTKVDVFDRIAFRQAEADRPLILAVADHGGNRFDFCRLLTRLEAAAAGQKRSGNEDLIEDIGVSVEIERAIDRSCRADGIHHGWRR